MTRTAITYTLAALLLILAFSAPFRGARPSWQRRAASIHALRHDHRKTEISKT